jgi:hypothetical protein
MIIIVNADIPAQSHETSLRQDHCRRTVTWSTCVILFPETSIYFVKSQFGLSQVVLNRWETGARQGHATANDSKIRLIYLTMQQDEYTRRINQETWELLHRLFGKVSREAAPVKMRIDPAVCSPEEVVSVEIEHLLHERHAVAAHQ